MHECQCMVNNMYSARHCLLPVREDAVAAALPVGCRRGAQQLVFAGVQRYEQVDHQAGVVDGLAEHCALLVLHQLLLLLFAQTGPSTQLLCCEVHSSSF